MCVTRPDEQPTPSQPSWQGSCWALAQLCSTVPPLLNVCLKASSTAALEEPLTGEAAWRGDAAPAAEPPCGCEDGPGAVPPPSGASSRRRLLAVAAAGAALQSSRSRARAAREAKWAKRAAGVAIHRRARSAAPVTR